MSLEKILLKVQSDINALTANLESFFEDTIQPSVSDCEILQQRLTTLQEDLAIYKYHKQISPSFHLHAKISEKELQEEKEMAPGPEMKKEPVTEKREQVNKAAEQPEKLSSSKTYPKLSISLNDKFRFINELFAQNNSEYSIAMEQLNNLKNWNDTEIYLNSLRSLYDWQEDKEIVNYFYALIKKRFD
jgi:hypothetical protein